MNAQHKTLTLVLGGAFAASLAIAPVGAADNPFALKPLSSGYMVADQQAGDKMQDGKCGASKEGAEGKTADGKCGASKKGKDAANAENKAKEGSCGSDKAKEGSCSSGKP